MVHTHTHTRPFNGPFPVLPGWAGTRKEKPIWILLKQERVSGSGISWAICKSAPRSSQITIPTPHHSVFYRPDALPATQPTASKHWRQFSRMVHVNKKSHAKFYLPPTRLSTNGKEPQLPILTSHRALPHSGQYSSPVPMTWPQWLHMQMAFLLKEKMVTHSMN